MKHIGKMITVVIVAAILAFVGFRTYRTIEARRNVGNATVQERNITKVAVQPVETATITTTVSVTGEVEAMATVEVVPKVTGRLEQLRLPDGERIDAGSRVEKGDVIAIIEHSALDAALRAAEASLLRAIVGAKPDVIAGQIGQADAAAAAAKAQLAEAEASLKNIKKEKERMTELFDRGAATEQIKDNAVAAYEAALKRKEALKAGLTGAEATLALAKAQIRELAEAAVAQAEAAVMQARVTLDEATIRAPITGVVNKKHVDEGDMVGPGRPLVTVLQMDTVKIIGGVSERYLAFLAPGKTSVTVAADAYPGEKFEGAVYRVGPDVDRGMRTVPVEVRISNVDHRLKPGMFTRLKLILARKENATVVPSSAIVRIEGKEYAYIVSDSTARRRSIKLGLAEGDRREIIEGLEPGDSVIVKGLKMIRDGEQVTVSEEDAR